jgi:asparagine synthase (glutamine-hydrolysing)
MANWIIIKDDNEDRRKVIARDLQNVISPIDGLAVGSAGGAGWSTVWSASRAAPVNCETDDKGGAVVWGDALDEEGKAQTAAAIRAAWSGGADGHWDGYYSAFAVDSENDSLTVGADLLGIFPVYYWSDGKGVVIVGSSPELFRYHPLFPVVLDMKGLVGILMTHGLVDNRALLAGVRRLGQGCRLRHHQGRLTEEVSYRIPEGEDNEMPFVAHVDMLHAALSDAIKRHTSGNSNLGMLLSGGLDSRMVAGYLHRLDIHPNALTLGLPSDLEMRCAKSVAREYGLNHVTGEPAADNYPDACRLMANWEHLASGFTNVRDWWTQDRLGSLGDKVVTGLLSDSLVGGCSVEWAFSEDSLDMTYETFVDQMPKLGIPADVLRRLLREEEHRRLVDETEQFLRDEFAGFGEDIPHCAWRYDLAHGQRYHVGSIAWRMSFGAWPIIPMLDRRVIATAASMPAASMADRELQCALVVERFPELAILPLDRSDRYFEEPEYLAPEAPQLIATMVRKWSRPARHLWQRAFAGEHRYWFRINDFSGAQWTQARIAAEVDRLRIEPYFDTDCLGQVLPPPAQDFDPSGPFIGESARKMLLGFMYWAKEHLDA